MAIVVGLGLGGLVSLLVVPHFKHHNDGGAGTASAAPSVRANSTANAVLSYRRTSTLDAKATVSKAALTPDGRYLALLVMSDNGPAVQIWDVQAKKMTKAFHVTGSTNLAVSPDGKTLVADAYEIGASSWKLPSGSPSTTYKLSYTVDGRGALAFSPDGAYLAHAETNGDMQSLTQNNETAMQLWNIATGRPLMTVQLAKPSDMSIAEVYTLAYSPDGARLAIGGSGLYMDNQWAQVLILDPKTGSPVVEFSPPTPKTDAPGSDVTSLAYSPDGRTLAMAMALNDTDSTYLGVTLWDAVSGRQTATLTDQGGGTVTFSPDGRTLAFGGVDGDSLELWDVASHRRTATLDLGQLADGSPSYAGGQLFSSDGRMLVVPVGDGVQIWSAS